METLLGGSVKGCFKNSNFELFFFYLNNIQTRSLPQELQRITEGAYFEYTYI